MTSDRQLLEDGFTLIELMTVVLIIAILVAIAVPSFLGARSKADDRQAEAILHTTLTAEKTFFADRQSYTNVGADLVPLEPTLVVIDNSVADPPSAGAGVAIQTDTGDDTSARIVCLTAHSASGSVFVVADEVNGAHPGTYYFHAVVAACDDAHVSTGGAAF